MGGNQELDILRGLKPGSVSLEYVCNTCEIHLPADGSRESKKKAQLHTNQSKVKKDLPLGLVIYRTNFKYNHQTLGVSVLYEDTNPNLEGFLIIDASYQKCRFNKLHHQTGAVLDIQYPKGKTLEENDGVPWRRDAVDIVDLEVNPVDDDTLARVKKYLESHKDHTTIQCLIDSLNGNLNNLTNKYQKDSQ